MKKLTATVLAAILLLSLTGCSKTEEPDNPYRLKTQIIERYDNGTLLYHTRYENIYDENGHVAQQVSYDGEEISVAYTYERDEYGNRLCTTAVYAGGTTQINENKLTLDDQHRVIREESYLDGELLSTSEYAYDENGNTTMLSINRIGLIDGEDWISWVDKTYDRDRNLRREDIRWSHSDGSYILYIYEDGRLVQSADYSDQDELQSYTNYTCDETGLVRTAVTYDAEDMVICKHITTSDEYGNVLRGETYFYNESLPGGDDEEMDSLSLYTYELIEPEE